MKSSNILPAVPAEAPRIIGTTLAGDVLQRFVNGDPTVRAELDDYTARRAGREVVNGEPARLRASAKDLIARADMLEATALLESGTRFWDIPSHSSDAEEGMLLEQYEPGRPVEYRVMPKADHNVIGAEWDSNHHVPNKNRIYPPAFAFTSIAEVRLLSTLTDDAGVELRRYVEVV